EDEQARGERDRGAHGQCDPEGRERDIVPRNFPLFGKSEGYRGGVEDRESGGRENEVAPVELVPPGEYSGGKDRGHDRAARSVSACASPESEGDEHRGEEHESRHESDHREPKSRKVDARNAEDPEQNDRRGDPGRHREESAQRFAFRGGQGLRGLIAPWHEWVEPRE